MKKICTLLLALLLWTAILSACSDRTQIQQNLDRQEAQEDLLPEDWEDWEEEEEDRLVPGLDDTFPYSNRERPSLGEAMTNNAQKDEDEITLIQFERPGSRPQARLSTSLGDITFVLYPDEAPRAVENFLTLAEQGFFDDKPFHFVKDGYAIRGGAVNSNGTGSRSIYLDDDGDQEHFRAEPSWDLWHFRGAVSLVPDSNDRNGSQFIIAQASSIYTGTWEDALSDGLEEEAESKAVSEMMSAGFPKKVIERYRQEGGLPYRDGYNTVFAHVIDGMDVVDAIAAVPADVSGYPTQDVIIQSVTILEGSDRITTAGDSLSHAEEDPENAAAEEDEEAA